jgi:hypothetical protein
MKNLRSPSAIVVAAALLFGCSDDSSNDAASGAGGGGTGGGAGAGGGVGTVSFAADIHPILVLKCSDQASQCHTSINNGPFQPGHAAPDVDDAYEETQEPSSGGEPIFERMLARVTTDGPMSMPPPYANPPCEGEIGSPGCISEAELALLQAWIDQGTPP